MSRVWLIFAFTSVAFAQPRQPIQDAVEWSVSLRGYMAQMSNPVVRTYGTANLARTVCTADPSAASALYRDAIASLFKEVFRGILQNESSTLLI